MASSSSHDSAALLASKKEASNTWMLLDANGNTTLLVVDKHAIMHRVGIHARDLRLLDPLLSYPSTILGRERAIVLNLEHIKAIITANEVLLRDPKNEFVVPLVEQLRRQLPGGESDSLEHEGSEGLAGKDLNGNGKLSPHHQIEHDDKVPESDGPDSQYGLPASRFEFRALEVALEAICSFLEAQTSELEKEAYPALDELTAKISSRNLDSVRKLKSRMTRLNARVQKVRDELEQLLDDDDDMADLFLTRRMYGGLYGGPSFLASSAAPNWASSSTTINSTTDSAEDVDELEMLLEAYFTQIDGILHHLNTLQEYIDDTEDFININLDSRRNKLIQMELILSTANVVAAAFALVTGIFGMNIPYPWNEDHPEAFTWVVVVTGIACLVDFILVLLYERYRHLLGK